MVFSRRVSDLSSALIIAPLFLPAISSATIGDKANIYSPDDAVEERDVQSTIPRGLFSVFFGEGPSEDAPSSAPSTFTMDSQCEVRVAIDCIAENDVHCNELELPSTQCSVGETINTLKFKLIDSLCDESRNSQDEKFLCESTDETIPSAGTPVRVSCFGGSAGTTQSFLDDHSTTMGDFVAIENANGGLPNILVCKVKTETGNEIQTMAIDTGGGEDLYLKNTFGMLQLDSCTVGNRPTQSCTLPVQYSYTVSNLGSTFIDVVKVERTRNAELIDLTPQASITELRAGENTPGDSALMLEDDTVDLCSPELYRTTLLAQSDPQPRGAPCFDQANYMFNFSGVGHMDVDISCISGDGVECMSLVSKTDDCWTSLTYSFDVKNVGTTDLTIDYVEILQKDNDLDMATFFVDNTIKPGEKTSVNYPDTINLCVDGQYETAVTVRANSIIQGVNERWENFDSYPFEITVTPSPTTMPSASPTNAPSRMQSIMPSLGQSANPSATPTDTPTTSPTDKPTFKASTAPSAVLSGMPSAIESLVPSQVTSLHPTQVPTEKPSTMSSPSPSAVLTTFGFGEATLVPSQKPSGLPSAISSGEPTLTPTTRASNRPTTAPSTSPLAVASVRPSQALTTPPTGVPTSPPSRAPSLTPTTRASNRPTTAPSTSPLAVASVRPSQALTTPPIGVPTSPPSRAPSPSPSSGPKLAMTSAPIAPPTDHPTVSSSAHPSPAMSDTPTDQCHIELDVKCTAPANLSVDGSCNFENLQFPGCHQPPAQMTLRYNGGDCSRSHNLQRNFLSPCEDYGDGYVGPSLQEGISSYIRVFGFGIVGNIYYDGFVKVGEDFIVAGSFPNSLNITIYDPKSLSNTKDIIQAENFLQTVIINIACPTPATDLFLNDRFGAIQLIEFQNSQQGKVSTFQNLDLNYEVSSDFDVELLSVDIVTNIENDHYGIYNVTNYVAGTIVKPGNPVSGAQTISLDLSRRTKYSAQGVAVGRKSEGHMCYGSDFTEFTAGERLPPSIPTIAPTAAPSASAFPSPDPMLSECSLNATITCTRENGEQCNDLRAPLNKTCVGSNAEELSFVYLPSSTCSDDLEDVFACTDFNTDVKRPFSVWVRVYEGSDTFYEGIVAAGQLFDVSLPTLSDEIVVSLSTVSPSGNKDTLLQASTLSIACERDNSLTLLKTYGHLQLNGFKNAQMGNQVVFTNLELAYRVKNVGRTDALLTMATTDSPFTGMADELLSSNAPKLPMGPGDTKTFIEIATVNLVAALGERFDFFFEIKGVGALSNLICYDISELALDIR